MADLNIQLNYNVRLSIKRAADAVDAYMKIPPFSLWDLVNFPKKREDKKKKERFRRTLSQVSQFLSDIVSSLEETKDIEEMTSVTCDMLCQLVVISDTDRSVLRELQQIQDALKAQHFITKLEAEVIAKIDLYYVFIWQKAEATKISVADTSLRLLTDFHRRPVLAQAGLSQKDPQRVLQRFFRLREPKPVMHGCCHTSLDSFNDIGRALAEIAETPSVRQDSRVSACSYRKSASTLSFFKFSQEERIPKIPEQRMRVQALEDPVYIDRKRNREARDGMTIDIRKTEHQKKKLRVEPFEVSTGFLSV
ncbi:MAG: hypothetical protein K0U37_00430 [Gammaproteobacteria bacterium]|nr:hypothetical protein [Gammaproteobacteria bacterium]